MYEYKNKTLTQTSFTRYNLYKESKIVDPLTKENYPDVLSVNYNLYTTFREPLTRALLNQGLQNIATEDNIYKTYKALNIIYRDNKTLENTDFNYSYDDILNFINKVPHVLMMSYGDEYIYPLDTDLIAIEDKVQVK